MMESQGRARATMFLALLALVGIAVKFLTIAALHFVRPDVNPGIGTDQQLRRGSLRFPFDCR
jgi:hypothetical protein